MENSPLFLLNFCREIMGMEIRDDPLEFPINPLGNLGDVDGR